MSTMGLNLRLTTWSQREIKAARLRATGLLRKGVDYCMGLQMCNLIKNTHQPLNDNSLPFKAGIGSLTPGLPSIPGCDCLGTGGP